MYPQTLNQQKISTNFMWGSVRLSHVGTTTMVSSNKLGFYVTTCLPYRPAWRSKELSLQAHGKRWERASPPPHQGANCVYTGNALCPETENLGGKKGCSPEGRGPSQVLSKKSRGRQGSEFRTREGSIPHPPTMTSFPHVMDSPLSVKIKTRGAWMAQSIEHLPLAQVMRPRSWD